MPDDVIEELILWFRQTNAATPYGEVGFSVTKHNGQITTRKHIYNVTLPAEPGAKGRARDGRA